MRMANDGWASDYLRDLNTYGPASANVPRPSVVSHQVRYQQPVVLTEAKTNDTPLYDNDGGFNPGPQRLVSAPVRPFREDATAAQRAARPKGTQSRSRGSAPANGVKTRSAPLSGSDVTADVLRSVKADGNTSFANWRQSLVNQGWDGDPSRIKYDPSTGKFVDTGGGVNSGAVTPEQTEAQASHRAESYPDEVGNTPVGGAQPAPASGAQPAPAKTEGSVQPTPAGDHEQEAKAAVDEFLKQHPADGKERLKSIYAAVDSQNIKDDAAYNLAVIAEIQKAQTPAGDHEQEAKAAVDEFLKQHPADGKERLKSIYAAVDSQNIKDDAAYNLAVMAEIQKEMANAAKAQAAAEAAEQRSDNPEGWL